MTSAAPHILTVGHSTHSFEAFLGLLRRHDVTAVADVRSRPYSRMNPQFNRELLEKSLAGSEIRYAFLGAELGARSEDPDCYDHGQVVYDRLAKTDLFQSGIARLLDGAASFRIALMCAEKEPLECHRTILVARVLADRGVRVAHILADGQLETHDATMDRLMAMFGLPAHDLFRSRDALVREAQARQERRIAYVEEKLVPPKQELS